MKRFALALLTIVAISSAGCAETSPNKKSAALGEPASYTCHRAPSAINIDGKLDDAAWKAADWTNDFIDVRGPGFPKPHLRTRCKLLWDDKNLYIAAELEDPDVWGTMTENGSHLYEENNFEVFLDPQSNARDYW